MVFSRKYTTLNKWIKPLPVTIMNWWYYEQKRMIWLFKNYATQGLNASTLSVCSKRKNMKFLMGIHYRMPGIKDIYNTIRRNEKQKVVQRTTPTDASAVYIGPRAQSNDSAKHDNNMSYTWNINRNQNKYRGGGSTDQNNEDRPSLLCT